MMLNKAVIFVVIAAIIWGGTPPIMKIALTEIPLFSLAFLRMSIASIILGFLIYQKLKIKRVDWSNFFWAAITGVTLNLTFFFIGLKLTQAILAAFLIASVPIFTLVAAHFYLKEKLTKRLVISSLIAIMGVIFIVGKINGQTTGASLLGNLFLLLSTLAWVAHEIIAKKLLKTYDGGTVAFYSMAIGAATFFPLFLFEYWQNPLWYQNVDIKGLLGLIYGIFGASLAAYWTWQKGLALMPAGQASFFFYIDPITGAILAMILLGEKLTPSLIVGGILITIAVFLAEQKRRTHPLHKKFN